MKEWLLTDDLQWRSHVVFTVTVGLHPLSPSPSPHTDHLYPFHPGHLPYPSRIVLSPPRFIVQVSITHVLQDNLRVPEEPIDSIQKK